MIRQAHIAPLAFCVMASTAVGQGVPTLDVTAVGRAAEIVRQLVRDFSVQTEKEETETTLAELHAEQLRALEEITAAITGPGFNIRALEGNADFGAAQVYPPVSNNPMDPRLFGEGRETIEMMIVQVAGEFADAPGVARAGLTPTQWRCLFQALIKQESRFSITAKSPVGAYGLTQLMPGTATDMGVDRTIPIENLRGGARYITIQLNAFGTIPKALAAYNAGPGRVIEYGGVPPFAETQGYVRRIAKFYNEYLAVIGGADALGTLFPSDMALAEFGNISDASVYYAADAYATTQQVIARLKAIIEQIDRQPNAKAAIELNSYAKAEIARILNLRIRLMAANQIREAAFGQHLAADRLTERRFKQMGVAE
jgi:Transglycosylase SLT domain